MKYHYYVYQLEDGRYGAVDSCYPLPPREVDKRIAEKEKKAPGFINWFDAYANSSQEAIDIATLAARGRYINPSVMREAQIELFWSTYRRDRDFEKSVRYRSAEEIIVAKSGAGQDPRINLMNTAASNFSPPL